jgi:hypothetical protein
VLVSVRRVGVGEYPDTRVGLFDIRVGLFCV